MSKKIIPFSNATEADVWMNNNCFICKTKCHYKTNMEKGFIFGDITLKTAEFIGIKQEYEVITALNDVCNHKDKYIKTKKQNNELTLF